MGSFSHDGRLIEGCEPCVMMVEGCALRLCYVVTRMHDDVCTFVCDGQAAAPPAADFETADGGDAPSIRAPRVCMYI